MRLHARLPCHQPAVPPCLPRLLGLTRARCRLPAAQRPGGRDKAPHCARPAPCARPQSRHCARFITIKFQMNIQGKSSSKQSRNNGRLRAFRARLSRNKQRSPKAAKFTFSTATWRQHGSRAPCWGCGSSQERTGKGKCFIHSSEWRISAPNINSECSC